METRLMPLFLPKCSEMVQILLQKVNAFLRGALDANRANGSLMVTIWLDPSQMLQERYGPN